MQRLLRESRIGRLETPTAMIVGAEENYELKDLEQTIGGLQRERPIDCRTSTMNAGSLYYDDTLVARKMGPVSAYMGPTSEDNDVYEDELVSTGSRLRSFDPNPPPFAGGTSQRKRQLPTPPPQFSGSSAFDRCLPPEQNGFQTCRKYYKDPSDRDSLMKALDTNKSPAEAKFTRQPQHSCCKTFVLLLLGILLTVFYVAATYFIVKHVAVEFCGGSAFGLDNKRLTLLYGEMDISRFNETWTSTIEFDSWFISEMNEAVQDTILWDYWMNSTVVGYTPPFSSWQNTTGRITCRFVLNLLLQPNRRRGVDTFARHTIESRLPLLAPGGASVRCVVFVEQDSYQDYECREVTATTTSSRHRNFNGR